MRFGALRGLMRGRSGLRLLSAPVHADEHELATALEGLGKLLRGLGFSGLGLRGLGAYGLGFRVSGLGVSGGFWA